MRWLVVYIFNILTSRCKYECENDHTESALNMMLTAGRCYRYPDKINRDGTCSLDNFNTSHVLECTEWVYDETESFVAEVKSVVHYN